MENKTLKEVIKELKDNGFEIEYDTLNKVFNLSKGDLKIKSAMITGGKRDVYNGYGEISETIKISEEQAMDMTIKLLMHAIELLKQYEVKNER